MDPAESPKHVAKWFSARITYESHVQGSTGDPLLEHTVVVCRAPSSAEANTLLREYAEDQEHRYRNVEGKTVSWKVRGLSDVYEIIDPLDENGWEVFSEFASGEPHPKKSGRE